MRKYSRIESYQDYAVPLLEVLADMPGHQARAADVLDAVLDCYGEYMADDAIHALPSGGPRWKKCVYWQKFKLARLGLVDSPAPRVWRITAEGLRWLRDNPDSVTIDLRLGEPTAPRKKRRQGAAVESSRRKSASTGEEQRRWVEIISQEVRQAREFLRGRATRPSDERLCDLVQLCYTLELYPEAQALFALIDPSRVNAWLYHRTSRLASICARKAKP